LSGYPCGVNSYLAVIVTPQSQALAVCRGEACLAPIHERLPRVKAKRPHAGPFFAVLKRRMDAPQASQHPDGQDFIPPRLFPGDVLAVFLSVLLSPRPCTGGGLSRSHLFICPTACVPLRPCGLRRPHDLVRCGSLIYNEVCGPSGRDQGAARADPFQDESSSAADASDGRRRRPDAAAPLDTPRFDSTRCRPPAPVPARP